MLAIEAQVPVVPVAIEGSIKVLPSDGIRLRRHPIRVKVGAPIPTKGLAPADRERAHAPGPRGHHPDEPGAGRARAARPTPSTPRSASPKAPPARRAG